MQNDINTQGHTQWFYFRVCNTRKGHSVRFNILNYSKPDSLFNYGMSVSMYSDKKATNESVGWFKGCTNIDYSANGIRKGVEYYSKSYYTLTFTHTFEYDSDVVYFAYSVPYTFSDLRDDLNAIEQDSEGRGAHMSRKTLCKTIAGEDCEILTITARDHKENFAERKGVVITARVHPGETVGSWMMRGVIQFLTDPNNEEAKLLRNNFVFKIVPMLNPDGVINGNYRCSLAGCDLNRRWKTPNKILQPTIYHVKKLVKDLKIERGCLMFCDLHGHSRK
jgi:cytosolic carboxypeptidase protein 2/3